MKAACFLSHYKNFYQFGHEILDDNTFTVTWAGTDHNITNQQILDKRAELEG